MSDLGEAGIAPQPLAAVPRSPPARPRYHTPAGWRALVAALSSPGCWVSEAQTTDTLLRFAFQKPRLATKALSPLTSTEASLCNLDPLNPPTGGSCLDPGPWASIRAGSLGPVFLPCSQDKLLLPAARSKAFPHKPSTATSPAPPGLCSSPLAADPVCSRAGTAWGLPPRLPSPQGSRGSGLLSNTQQVPAAIVRSPNCH